MASHMALRLPRGVSFVRSLPSFLGPPSYLGYLPTPTPPLLNTKKIFNSSSMDKGYSSGAKETPEYKSSGVGPASDDILSHILNLYASKATPKDFEIYVPDATFEDPLMCAHGVKQIKSSFYSLGKVFSESRIVDYSITENDISPGKKEILIDNKQYYKFWGRDIHMISLIKLYTEGGKVVRHEDWWDKKPPRSRKTVKVPVVGRIFELSRRASMFATHAMMGFGKDPHPTK
ncbi:unnamed protein product [Cuscuta epithymum]|uniref:SnoaL-like domain-containing protein n=1 Tax=Cuscuta epithymum TaxID=186058 RepID=A0AAV0EJ05_9ASTE|nr:unnamed protein product [Cuscuta epithymum]